MKKLLKMILSISILSSSLIAYEVASLGSANVMVCSYSKTYANHTWHRIPEFEQSISYMKVRKGGRVIIAPKGTRYVYISVDDNDATMKYESTSRNYTMYVYPTKRAKSIGGTMHNYTDILVLTYTKSGDTRGASGSCRLEVQ